MLPRSLFGRLMWVLLLGLLVAQLLSAWVNFEERDRLLFRSGGLQTAQRIADTVLLLDSLSRAERSRIVAILNVPPQVVRLDDVAGMPAAGLAETARAEQFALQLQGLLGTELPLRVFEKPRPAAFSGDQPARRGRWRPMMEGRGLVPDASRSPGPGRARLPAWVLFVTEVRLSDGQTVLFETEIPRPPASLPLRLLLTLGILLVAVLALSFFAVRWITRPLQLLSSAAEGLGKDIHRPPLPETGPAEVAQAARAFNTMQQRLVRYIEDRSRIFSAMSHDLKTPITRLRLRAELLEDEGQRQRFEQDLKEMEAMVSESLNFMRGLEGSLNRQPVDLMALLEGLQADHAEMGHSVEIEGQTAAPFFGDAALLKRCLNNLIDNAIRYGQGAKVMVDDRAESMNLRIQDEGPGIPELEREKVFEPFYRIEVSRSRDTGGTGLGLSIARSIVERHNGTITLQNRLSGGLEVVVNLPRVVASGPVFT